MPNTSARAPFEMPRRPEVEIAGGQGLVFPVRRIWCVGRNYAEHTREMGGDPSREPPFFFSKPADAVVPDGSVVPYPPRTADLHHEVELVVAIGRGGQAIEPSRAAEHIHGYAVGLDLTRRDLQREARAAALPWEAAKAFDGSAPVSAIHTVATHGHVVSGRIWLEVNGRQRQEGDVAQLIWSVPEIIAELSSLVALAPGDLIYTGTPAGVGPLERGDEVTCGVAGLATLAVRIA